MRLAYTALERVAIVLASLALSVGLIALLSGFFAGRDQAGISGGAPGPGKAFGDQGSALLQLGHARPVYDSNPPTSGAHFPQPVLRDESELNNDQLLGALAAGDVVIMYGGRTPPPGLKALADTVGSPFTAPLAAAGQAVILAHRPGTTGLIGLAWAHIVRVAGPQDPLLKQFAGFWLARGAPRGARSS
ncbi:MAG: DUF3105 domain-containing protein [Solirubrobacteraceae bacterium]